MPKSTVLRKRCGDCKKLLPVSSFAKNKDSKDGLSWRCKPCHVAYVRRHREKNPDYYRKVQLRYKFGITPEEYDALLARQDGACAICGQEETALGRHGEVKLLSVDHNHETGEVRGLLCQRCNIGLGHFLTSENLIAAAAYLVQNETAVAVS